MQYITKLIKSCHRLSYSKKFVHVIQLWHDGLVTTRYGGRMQNDNRAIPLPGLCSIEQEGDGLSINIPVDAMPEIESGETQSRGFAYVRHPEAVCLREAMRTAARNGGDLTKQQYRSFKERLQNIPT